MESESIQTLAFKLLKPTTKHPRRKIGGKVLCLFVAHGG